MYDLKSTKIPSEIKKLLAKSAGYQWLGMLFRHPARWDDSFEVMVRTDWQEITEALGQAQANPLEAAAAKLILEIQQTERASWLRAYENIFGHTACSKAPLYELEYGEEHSHRQPQELADISGFYRAFGLQPSQSAYERPDHVCIEFEFVYFLLYKQAVALHHGQEEQSEVCRQAVRSFLRDHLAQWIPALTYRMIKHTDSGVIRAIAEFAYGWVNFDCRDNHIPLGSEALGIRQVEEQSDAGCVSCHLSSPEGGLA